jgi:hypothetical protein
VLMIHGIGSRRASIWWLLLATQLILVGCYSPLYHHHRPHQRRPVPTATLSWNAHPSDRSGKSGLSYDCRY